MTPPPAPPRPRPLLRVPLLRPFTGQEEAVVELLGEGMPPQDVAAALHIQLKTLRGYMEVIARKIPGTLPQHVKIVLWFRGANADLLSAFRSGRAIYEVTRERDVY